MKLFMEAELEEEIPREILSFYEGKRGELIPILLEVQANFGYLPEEAIQLTASFLNITEGEIYSVASFYAQFRLLPLGRQRVTICRGTACHIRGAPQILQEVERALGLKEGETSSDLELYPGNCCLYRLLCSGALYQGQYESPREMTPEKIRDLFPVPGEDE